MNDTFLGMGRTLESWMLNLMKVSSKVTLLRVKPIGYVIKIHKSYKNIIM